jgi:probable rRNA maturation factor
LAINFFTEDIAFKFTKKKDLKNWIKEVIVSEKKVIGNINYIFTSDNYLLEINQKYLNHNTYTDIITFNYDDGNIINGDIYVSIDRVKENATKYSDNFELEFYRVMIHGVLHLIGYDDTDEDLKTVIRNKEDDYLKILVR